MRPLAERRKMRYNAGEWNRRRPQVREGCVRTGRDGRAGNAEDAGDAAGAKDAEDAGDAADAKDVEDAGDVADVKDAGDVADVKDAKDGRTEKRCGRLSSGIFTGVTRRCGGCWKRPAPGRRTG